MTTPPNDPWATGGSSSSHWDQPPGGPPPPPPPGWGGPPGQPPMPPPGAPAPPPGWPQQGTPGDWSAPGYGNWAPQRNNGLGTAALVTGIFAVLLCWTIVGGVILGVLGLVFGIIGRGRVKRREADNGGSATAGIVLGSLGLVLTVAVLAIGFMVAKQSQEDYEECLAQGQPQTFCETIHEPPDP